jgi:outer membrane immunogenic protein
VRLAFLCCAFASAAAVSSVNAGDFYKDGVRYNSWSGFYAGGIGGYASDALSGALSGSGAFSGGLIGYNWESVSHLVLGLETDLQGAAIAGSGSDYLQFHGVTDRASEDTSLDYFGTARGRLGYAMGQALLYATGGFAYGNVRNGFHDLTNGAFFHTEAVRMGFAAGGGLEYKLRRALSFKVEYQYIDLSHATATDPLRGSVATRDTELNTVRGGIAYHF